MEIYLWKFQKKQFFQKLLIQQTKIKFHFLAVKAALYLTMSVVRSVMSFNLNVTSFMHRMNAQNKSKEYNA